MKQKYNPSVFVGCSKSSAKNEIYSIECRYQETRKIYKL